MKANERVGRSLAELATLRLRTVRVAILDTGVDAAHPVLRGRCAPSGDRDDAGHGTAVAGILARLAPNAVIVSRRVLDADCQGDGDDVLSALEAVLDSDVEIINLSLTVDPVRHAQRFERILTRAKAARKVIVAAADNLMTQGHVGFPAVHPDVLGVAAGGECPVWHFTSPVPDSLLLAARSENLLTAHLRGGYCRVRGTSFATPVVSAACALLAGAGFTGDTATMLRHLSAIDISRPQDADPLETAPEFPGEDWPAMTYVCPVCGEVRQVDDAFGKVRCHNCFRIGCRRTLLDLRDLVGILEYVRKGRRFDARLPREEEIRLDVRRAYSAVERNRDWSVVRKRTEVYAALVGRLPNVRSVLERLSIPSGLRECVTSRIGLVGDVDART